MPETHDPESQTTPHVPQLFGSVPLTTQFEVQQLTIVPPPLAEPEHALKQEPQLAPLDVRSTQAIPHSVSPAPHSIACPESSSPVSAVLASAAGEPVSSYMTVPS